MVSMRLLKIKEVLTITGLSRATLYRRIQTGDFPAPVKVSLRAIRFRSTDLEGWIQRLSATSTK